MDKKALELSAFLMKNQLFYDGNKRIAMLAANQVLISHGCGVLSVSQEKLESFLRCWFATMRMRAQRKNCCSFCMAVSTDSAKSGTEICKRGDTKSCHT